MARFRAVYAPGTFLILLGAALLGLSLYLDNPNTPVVATWSMRPGMARAPIRPTGLTSGGSQSRPVTGNSWVGAPAPQNDFLKALKAAAGAAAGSKGTIVVIGATGLSGSETVFQALKRGYKVIGLARTPSKLVVPAGSGGETGGQPLTNPNLKMVQGSVVNMADVRAAFSADDIIGVVVALGGKTSEVGKTMLTDGTRNVIEAMKDKGVKRISIITSIGTGDSEQQAPFFFRVLMSTVMSGIFKDKNNQEALFLQGPGADLEYTIVRPGGLTVQPPTGVINVIDGEAGSISRADVAAFCLDAVTDPEWKYLKKTPCISSTGGTSWTKDRSAAARGGM